MISPSLITNENHKFIFLFYFSFFISISQNMRAPKVYEYVNNLISMLPEPEKFRNCDFSILCEKFPLMMNMNNFRAKVLYISLKNTNNETLKFYPDKITELGLENITITTNLRRRLTMKAQEFFINGNTEPQEYKGNDFYHYSLERTSMFTKSKIKELRQKYNLVEPEIFVGHHQELIL